MRQSAPHLIIVALTAALGLPGLAGDGFANGSTPTPPASTVGPGLASDAQILFPREEHPDVAVSRSLWEQPVHPHLVQVQMNTGPFVQELWLDPLDNLEINSGIDDNHWIMKYRRLYRQLNGVTTSDLAAHRNAELAARPRAVPNSAQVILPNGVDRIAPFNMQPKRALATRSVIVVPRKLDSDIEDAPSDEDIPTLPTPPNNDPQEKEGKTPRLVQSD